jgi:hypothetical protein
MGPGRTGVKGVIRDRNEAAVRERSRKAEELAELSARMERANLGGKTFLEERDESFMLEGRQRGRFGHLREVGLSGFVPAVEEDRNVWVVVHIYDPVSAMTHVLRLSPATHLCSFCLPWLLSSHLIDAIPLTICSCAWHVKIQTPSSSGVAPPRLDSH